MCEDISASVFPTQTPLRPATPPTHRSPIVRLGQAYWSNPTCYMDLTAPLAHTVGFTCNRANSKLYAIWTYFIEQAWLFYI